MARELARRLGYTYVDSGAMYRAVTLYAMEHGMASADKGVDTAALVKALPEIQIGFSHPDSEGVQHTLLNGRDVERQIRSLEVSELVSPVATIPEVRERLVRLQQDFGRQGGIVMDGRDIGTVVFPDAELKVFVTASDEVRARRRCDELAAKGQPADYAEVLANVRQRDYIDSHRDVAPLRQAPDALVLDNSLLTLDEQQAWLRERFAERVAGA